MSSSSVFIQIITFLSLIIVIRSAVTPIVLWHGMGDTCCSPNSLGNVQDDLLVFSIFSIEEIKMIHVHYRSLQKNIRRGNTRSLRVIFKNYWRLIWRLWLQFLYTSSSTSNSFFYILLTLRITLTLNIHVRSHKWLYF